MFRERRRKVEKAANMETQAPSIPTNGNGNHSINGGGFDYEAHGILPGDIAVNDRKHINGERVFYVFHSNHSGISFPQHHEGEKIVKCPLCSKHFWVPGGADVHPSCPKRPKKR